LKFKILIILIFSNILFANEYTYLSDKILSVDLNIINILKPKDKIEEVKIDKNNVYITPFQYHISKKYNDFGFEINKKYVEYLLNNKGVKDLSEIERVLNSKNLTLNYYEGILKIIYFYYIDKDLNKYFFYIFDKIYDRGFSKIQNVFEGFLIQDMILSFKDKKYDYNHLISEFDYCKIEFFNSKEFEEGCEANQILLMCLNNKENYLDYLNLLALKDYKLAEYTHSYCQQIK